MRGFLSKNVRAMTLLEVLVVIAVLAVLVVLWLPSLSSARHHSGTSCASNLKWIGVAFRLWAEDNGGKFPMQVSVTNGGSMEFVDTPETFYHFQVVSNELGTSRILFCPADTKRGCATNFTSDFNNTRISYFLGVNATKDQPQKILAGDRNLTLDGRALAPGLHSLSTNDLPGWSRELHRNQGNIVLADCSVQQTDSQNLPNLFQKSGVATNRLSIP